MCGIVGFITSEPVRGSHDRRKFIEQALIAGTVRGDDSTGVFSTLHKQPENETADWLKMARDGYGFIATKEFQDRFGLMSDYGKFRSVIGHGRSATVGTVTQANAHPFQEGPITLVHNGTLTSTFHMGKSMHDLKDEGVQVDSHVIAHNLATTTDAASVIAKLDGAYALVWHDARDDSINIVRNERRPLHLMFATCEDTVLIASEAEMLYWLAKRNNFGMSNIVYPKANELLKFTPGSLVPEVSEVPMYAPLSTGRTGWGTTSTTTTSSAASAGVPWRGGWPKIPEDMELALMEFELDAEMELRFELSKIQKVLGRTTAIVSGMVFHPEGEPINGIIHGLDYNAVQDAMVKNETWTVRCVGLQWIEKETPMLMVKLVSRSYYPSGNRIIPPNKTHSIPRLKGRGTHEYVPGPHGEWIPIHAWLEDTANGCCQCGMDIMADEAEEVTWINNESQPLCAGCVEENKVLALHDFH